MGGGIGGGCGPPVRRTSSSGGSGIALGAAAGAGTVCPGPDPRFALIGCTCWGAAGEDGGAGAGGDGPGPGAVFTQGGGPTGVAAGPSTGSCRFAPPACWLGVGADEASDNPCLRGSAGSGLTGPGGGSDGGLPIAPASGVEAGIDSGGLAEASCLAAGEADRICSSVSPISSSGFAGCGCEPPVGGEGAPSAVGSGGAPWDWAGSGKLPG